MAAPAPSQYSGATQQLHPYQGPAQLSIPPSIQTYTSSDMHGDDIDHEAIQQPGVHAAPAVPETHEADTDGSNEQYRVGLRSATTTATSALTDKTEGVLFSAVHGPGTDGHGRPMLIGPRDQDEEMPGSAGVVLPSRLENALIGSEQFCVNAGATVPRHGRPTGPNCDSAAPDPSDNCPNASLSESQWHITSFLADTSFSDPVAIAMVAQGSVPAMRQRAEVWEKELSDCPDRSTVTWFIHGLRHGFLLGSSLPAGPEALRAPGDPTAVRVPRNNKSAMDNPEVIGKSIAEELELGCNLGPFDQCPTFAHQAFVNPLGVAFKRISDPPFRKARRTTDASQSGVNATIRSETASVSYITFRQICARLEALPAVTGRGFVLDVKSAFRNLPLAPQELHKMVFFWDGAYYVDLRLVFGVSTGPAIWSAVAELLLFVVRKHCVSHRCDFLVLIDDNLGSSVDEQGAREGFETFISTAERLGVPIAMDKNVEPTTAFVYVGLHWNISGQMVSLPAEKWARMKTDTDAVLRTRSAWYSTFESLVGFLAFCAQVTPFGYLYLRHCYACLAALNGASSGRRNLFKFKFVTIHAKARAELQWWNALASTSDSNVAATLPLGYHLQVPARDKVCATDSSPSGYGGHWRGSFFCEHWPTNMEVRVNAERTLSTGLTEITAVFIALNVFKEQWSSSAVTILCDNSAAVLSFKKRSSSSSRITAVLRDIVDLSLRHHIQLSLVWIPAASNIIADFLSRIMHCDKLSDTEQNLLLRFQLRSRYRTPAAVTRSLQFF